MHGLLSGCLFGVGLLHLVLCDKTRQMNRTQKCIFGTFGTGIFPSGTKELSNRDP